MHLIKLELTDFAGFVIDELSEYYRMSKEWRWMYVYGQRISGLFLFTTLLCSLINSLVIVMNNKGAWKPNAEWAIIGLIAIIYLVISMLAWHYEL